MKKGSKKTVDEKIDDLAISVKNGFDQSASDLKGLEDRLTDSLDKIEFNTNSQERRITILEDKVRMISVKVGLSK